MPPPPSKSVCMCHNSAAGWCLLGATIRNNPFPAAVSRFSFFYFLSPETVYLRAACLQSTRQSALITVAVKTQVIVLELGLSAGRLDKVFQRYFFTRIKNVPRGLIYTSSPPPRCCFVCQVEHGAVIALDREQCWLMFTRTHPCTQTNTQTW